MLQYILSILLHTITVPDASVYFQYTLAYYKSMADASVYTPTYYNSMQIPQYILSILVHTITVAGLRIIISVYSCILQFYGRDLSIFSVYSCILFSDRCLSIFSVYSCILYNSMQMAQYIFSILLHTTIQWQIP